MNPLDLVVPVAVGIATVFSLRFAEKRKKRRQLKELLQEDTNQQLAQSVNSNHLPDSLQPLIPYAKYAVGDDSLRSQLAATLTRTAKNKLITEVGPLLPEINSFLDSFGDGPVSDEAIVMGSLAEFVCELEVDKP